MAITPLFIGNEIYRLSSYGSRHPLAIPRVSTATDLARAMGWLPDHAYRDSPRATPEALARFHDPAYVQALQDAERDQDLHPDRRARFNIGKMENPIFPEIFSRPATAAGASLLAASLLTDGGIVYSPASGTHHGRRDRASGFCYLNDPVLGMLALLDRGIAPIAYIDVDAHHGDGVEDAFADDDRVLTVSVHEAGRWPGTGTLGQRNGNTAHNIPVPLGFNDSEMDFVCDHALVPLVQAFKPAALVLQCGADAVADDPLSRLALSNGALWRVVTALRDLALQAPVPRLFVTGGGGYNPWSVGRCWAGVWATLNGIAPPVPASPEAERILRALTWHRAAGRNPPVHWLTTIADPPRPGPIGDDVRRAVDAVVRP